MQKYQDEGYFKGMNLQTKKKRGVGLVPLIGIFPFPIVALHTMMEEFLNDLF